MRLLRKIYDVISLYLFYYVAKLTDSLVITVIKELFSCSTDGNYMYVVGTWNEVVTS